MNRRRLLQLTLPGASALLTGCVANGSLAGDEETTPQSSNNSSTPSEILEWDFETEVNTEASAGEDPIINVNREKNTITVEGVGWYGSSHCGYLCAKPPEYEEETATLSVKVSDKLDEDKGGKGGCADDAAADSYRIKVIFDEGIPDRIEAAHPWEHRTVREFE